MKLHFLAAMFPLAAIPSAQATGWKSCDGKKSACKQTRVQKPAREIRARRYVVRERDYNDLPTREWFFRRMLDN
jgi:hypothetical protein